MNIEKRELRDEQIEDNELEQIKEMNINRIKKKIINREIIKGKIQRRKREIYVDKYRFRDRYTQRKGQI